MYVGYEHDPGSSSRLYVDMDSVHNTQVLMGAGLAGRPPCLSQSQVLMGAGLVGRPPCLSQSQVLMGAGLAWIPPYIYLPHSVAYVRTNMYDICGYEPTLPVRLSSHVCWS